MKEKGVAASFFQGVSRVEAPDARTVRITLDKPLVDFLLGTPPRREVQIQPKELVDDGTITKVAIGTGPMMTTRSDESRIVFERNPDYWGRRPYLDGAEVRVILDVSARLAAFR